MKALLSHVAARARALTILAAALLLALGTCPAWALPITDVSPAEMAGMQLLYAVNDGQFDFNDAYTVNNSGSIPAGSFSRVGYYVQLGSNWVWASMDTFNTDPTKLGVPKAGTNIIERATLVHNLHVETNAGSPVTPGNYNNGDIEFWASNYDGNGGGLYGSNNGLYDWADGGQRDSGGGHGSFQVFSLNDALTVGHTLFGVTAGGGSGIGDQPGNGPNGNSPDWTFGPGTGSYAVRNLEIWVGSPAPTTTLTWDGTVNNWSTSHWTPGPVAGPNDPTTKGIVASGNVTVNGNFTAFSLQLDGGQVTMGPNNTLTLSRGIQSSGGTLALTNGSRVITDLAGGSIANLSVSGTATLEARSGTVTVANTTMASSLVKAGAGTVQLQAVTAAPGSTFNVSAGTLAAQAPNFIGQAGLVLSGGTFQVSGQTSVVTNAVKYGMYWGANNDANLSGIDDGVLNGKNGGLFNLTPNPTGTWTTQMYPGNYGNNYAHMLWGNFTAPQTGSYTFWYNHDDTGVVWLDLNQNGDFEQGAGERLIYAGCCGQQSAAVSLTGGQTYAFATAFSQGGGGNYGNLDIQTPSLSQRPANPSDASQNGFWSYNGVLGIGMTGTPVSVAAYTAGSRISATTDVGANFGTLTFGAASDLTLAISNPDAPYSFAKIVTNGDASLGLSGNVTSAAFDDQGVPGTFRLYGTKTLTLNPATTAALSALATNFRIETGATLSLTGPHPLGLDPHFTLAGGTLTLTPTPAGSDLIGMENGVTVVANSTLNLATTGAVALGNLDFSAPSILTTAGSTSGLTFVDTTFKTAGTSGFNTGVRTFTGATNGGGFAPTIVKQGASDLILTEGGVGLAGAQFQVQAGRLVVDGPSNVTGATLNIAGGQIVLASPNGANQTYSSPIISTASGILTAGTGGVGVASGNISVSSLTPGAGTTIELRAEGAQALLLPNGATAPGSLNVSQGNVQIGAAASVGSLKLTGGTTTLGGNTTLTGALTGTSASTLVTQGNIAVNPGGRLEFGGQLHVASGSLTLTVPAFTAPPAGLQMWFDASDVNADWAPDGLPNGAAVSTWSDKSGQNHPLTQGWGDATRYPSIFNTGIGGKPVVRFDGNDYLWATNYDSNNPFTIFAVSNMEGSQNGRLISSQNINWLMGYHGGQEGVLHADGWITGYGESPLSTAVNTIPDLYAATNTGGPLYQFFKNGTDITAHPTGGNDRIGQLALGGYQNANELSKGDVAEILMFNRVLTPAELNQVGGYLAAKYGIASPNYTGSLVAAPATIGDVRLASGTQLTLTGPGTAQANSIGGDGGPVVTGPMQLSSFGAPTVTNASPLTIDATINATNFNVTGPGTVALKQNLTVAAGGSLSVASNATLSAQNSLVINASSAAISVSGGLDVSGAPGTTLTFNVAAVPMPSGLLARYDASTLVLNNGDPVTTWADSSPNGRTATQNTDHGTPTYLATDANGHPAVQFLTAALNISSAFQPKEEYMVFRSANGATFGPDWGAVIGAQDGNGWMLQGGTKQFWDDNNHRPTAVSQNGNVVTGAAGNPFPLPNDVSQYFVMKVDLNANDSSAARTGFLGRNGGWWNSNLDIAEVLAFDHALTGVEENNLGGFLAAKYGIATAYTGNLGGPPSLGNLTMAPGTNLVLGGFGQATFSSIRTGAGATITGNVTANGPVAPGSSPGTLNIIGNYTQAAGSSYEWETVGNGAGQSDLIAITGNLNASANWTLAITPLAPVATGAYNLFTYGGALTGGAPWSNVTLTKTGAYADLVNLAGSSIDSASTPGTVKLNLAMNAFSNWTSGGDINWNVAGNWNSGAGPVPTNSIAAIVNTNVATATVTQAMGPQAASSLVVDNGRVLVNANASLAVTNNANVTSAGQLTVNGSLKVGTTIVNVVTPASFSGLIGYWPFSEGTGATTTADLSGGGHPGTINAGATWVNDGTRGWVLNFPASGSVNIPSAAFSALAGSGQVTLSLWQYGDVSQPRNDYVFEGRAAGGQRLLSSHLPWGDSNVYWDAGNVGGYDRINKAAVPAEYKGVWNNWTYVKDASAGTMQIYLNGALWHSGAGLTRTLDPITSFYIGADGAGGTSYAGMLDDFAVWNRALSASEILTLSRGTTTTQVGGTLTTAGTTTFGPNAALDIPRINVIGGTTTGTSLLTGEITTLAANTTLRLAGGTLAGAFKATNTSTTAGSYAYEVETGTSNAFLNSPLASLRKSTAASATLNGSVNLNRMDIAEGSLTMKNGNVNALSIAAGSNMTLTDSIKVANDFSGSGTLNVPVNNVALIDIGTAASTFGGNLRVLNGNPGNPNNLLTIIVPSSLPPPPAGQLDNPGIPAGEKAGLRLVYELPIPAQGNWNNVAVPYTVNNAGSIANGSFNRVAYYLDLNNSGQWAYVSFDANGFTNNASKIGVPNAASGEFYHYPNGSANDATIRNMNVYSNVGSIVTGTGIQTGNIEFWATNYGGNNDYGVPGAAGSFDFGDGGAGGGGTYGSMQIHNYGAAQTIFSYNNWNGGATSDLGIGNRAPATPTGPSPAPPPPTPPGSCASSWATACRPSAARNSTLAPK